MSSNNTTSSLGSDEQVSPSAVTEPSPIESESSWQTLRIIGRQHYENGQYDAAYYAFHHAYSKLKAQQSTSGVVVSKEELQFLLSNVIACRLQIGGFIHLQTAIAESKECIAINPTWSKAYIRLASSYMALRAYESQRRGTPGNENENRTNDSSEYSNDICNALQTAIRHDPNNTTSAKQMLLQELRHRNQNQNGTNRTGGSTNPPPINPNYIPPSTSMHNNNNNSNNNHEATDDPSTNRRGNTPTPLEGFRDHNPQRHGDAAFRGTGTHQPYPGSTGTRNRPQPWSHWSEYGTRLLQSTRTTTHAIVQQLQLRYRSLSDHQRQALTFLFVLLLLLGMYSMDHQYGTSHKRPRKMKGNYGSNNIYEQIRQEKLQRQQQRQYHNRQSPEYENYNTQNQQYHDPTIRMTPPQHYSRTTTMSRSSSFEVNGILYMTLVAGAVYIGHAYFGINPWQMILFLRMVQNGGGGGGGFMRYNNGGVGRGRHPFRRRGYW